VTTNVRSDGMGHSLIMPFLTGLYLGVNAIEDAYLVVDGPNCVFFRTSQITGNHDWHSTLVNCTGLHRVADTDCTTERAATGDQRLLVSRLQQVDAIEDCRMILLSAMSLVAVTAPQYDKVLREMPQPLSKPVVQVRSGSLSGDWLHGYSALLDSLANQIELPKQAKRAANDVAIVGYLMDRNEADHTGNLEEIKRLLAGMGLNLVSCWLNGGKVEDLEAIASAGTILSFPYGRKAAEILAERSGARLICCDLPLGAAATCKWLETIASELGREKEAASLIDREMREVVPKLEWILPFSMVNRRIVLMGSDPVLLEALNRATQELGCRTLLKVYICHRDHLKAAGVTESTEPGEEKLIYNPTIDEFKQAVEPMIRQDGLDLAISNSRALPLLSGTSKKLPFIELGFPSYNTHALCESPFLGFQGTLRLVERMTNTINHAEVYLR